MKPLSLISRAAIGLASLSMIATYFIPLWQIQLWAPQYPEGLNMKIWHNHLSGAFDIINGLNHYIGMREIKEEMFPEFQYIGILLGIFIALGLVTAVLGKRLWLFLFTGMAYLYGVLALYDFYRWGYDYGHNLDDHAAIKVPGMAYQPPVIGYKNLLNFTAYSGPDSGGWIIIGVGILATVLLAREWYQDRKKAPVAMAGKTAVLASLALVVSLYSCSSGPEPIRYGQDACHFCKMTITDKRFGSEIVTTKGKTYKFDDLNCLVNYLKMKDLSPADIAQVLAIDFNQPGSFTDVKQAFFLHNEAIKSPMRSDIATFSNEQDRAAVRARLGGGDDLNWDGVQTQ